VLVPLFRDAGGEPHAVLTRRRADLRRHAGEISFPGGRRDPEDADLRETALRETEEEIGLERTEVRVLGELPPVSTFVTGYLIHPFVGLIPAGRSSIGGQRWRPSPREVDAVLELPLRTLRESRTRTPMERRGISFETDAYIVAEHLIWGATARILDELYEQIDTILPAGAMPSLGSQHRRPLPSRLHQPEGNVDRVGVQDRQRDRVAARNLPRDPLALGKGSGGH
jgi:8-oxo-dGTP pyrophosphatase MutT (NUDIX family)